MVSARRAESIFDCLRSTMNSLLDIRVAAISFGPVDIYFIIGSNKITDDYESAMYRARNIAAPLNARRLNRNTPCALKADKCYDCSSPDRICRNFSVFHEKPFGARYHIILVNEVLGY